MKRRLAVLAAVTLVASLAGCSDDDKKPATQASAAAPVPSAADTVEAAKPPLPESPGASGRPGAFSITATGLGPYEIGASRAALDADGLLGTVTDAGAGCATATGSDLFNPPALTLAQNKLALVRVTAGKAATEEGIMIGAAAADVRKAYPAGSAVTGAGGVTGWSVPDGANTLLFEITADKVSALTTGTAATVTKVFTTGQGC
jgi:hypothetical protein